MSADLLKETILHGNLDLVYLPSAIKKIDIKYLYETLKEFNIKENSIYRFFINYKLFVNVKEIDLIKLKDKDNIYLIKILENLIEKAENLDVFDKLDIRINTCDYNSVVKVFIYNLLHFLYDKIRYYYLDDNSLSEYFLNFKETFEKFNNYFISERLIINYVIPLDANPWKPSWKITYNNEDYYLEGVDTFIDNTFRFYNISCYSHLMFLEIRYIVERLDYLKIHAKNYYQNYIKGNVNQLTNNIFDNFPLQIIYRDYYEAMVKHEDFYRPKITEYIRVEHFNKENYILAILPSYLTAYLLGYPILSCDVPSIKNMYLKIRHFNSETYYENLAKNFNTDYHKVMSLNIECANPQDENQNYLNLFYNRIIDFNIDDTCQFFNNGIYHYFTSPEYSDLSKKATNPYNRSEFKIIDPIIYNLRFKRKTKRMLYNKGISVELNSTLKDNFLEIKQALETQEITINSSLLDRGLNFTNESLFNLLFF